MPCRINKRRDWTVRILLEQLVQPSDSFFATLTYEDHHLPRTSGDVSTLRKLDLQKFLQKAKRSFGHFRYFGVGEYGTRTLRPHYHLCLFPRDHMQANEVLNSWAHGHTQASALNRQRVSYTAKYTTKKLTDRSDARLAKDQEPEFILSSRFPGVGAPAVPALVAQYRTGAGKKIIEERGDVERFIRFEGKVYPIPAYILGKMRYQLGIPRTHEQRLCHDGYEQYHGLMNRPLAEQNPTEAAAVARSIHAKERRKEVNTWTI